MNKESINLKSFSERSGGVSEVVLRFINKKTLDRVERKTLRLTFLAPLCGCVPGNLWPVKSLNAEHSLDKLLVKDGMLQLF